MAKRFHSFLDEFEEGAVPDQSHLDCLDVACPFLVFGKTSQKRGIVDDGVGNGKGAYPVFLAEEIDAVLNADAAIALAERGGGKTYETNSSVSSACCKSYEIQSCSSSNDHHERVPANTMFVQVAPDLFDETPVVLGCFASFNE